MSPGVGCDSTAQGNKVTTNVSCSMSPNLNVTNYKLLQTFIVV